MLRMARDASNILDAPELSRTTVNPFPLSLSHLKLVLHGFGGFVLFLDQVFV